MGVLEFIAIGTVDHIGNGFRLHQVHSAIQKRTTRVLAGFGKAHAFDTLDNLNQFAHDNRIAMRIKFQNIFACVGIRTFKKDVEETINDLRRGTVIACHRAIIPRSRQLSFAGFQIF